MRDNIATAMPAMGFLGGGAAAIGRGLEIGLPDDDRRIASCLWITPVARPATGKSSMMEPLKVLVAVYKEEEAAWRASYNETQAKIKTLFGEAKAQEGKNWNLFKKKNQEALDLKDELEGSKPCWFGEDFTPEAVIEAMSATKRAPYFVIASSEGCKIVQNLKGGQYGKLSTDDVWVRSWGGNESIHRLRLKSLYSKENGLVEKMRITACFAIQPPLHDSLEEAPFCNSGFSQRRLFALVEPNSYISPMECHANAKEKGIGKPDMREWNRWFRGVFKAYALRMDAEFVKIGDKAQPVWEQWYRYINSKIVEGKYPAIEGHLRRTSENAARIALVLHVMKNRSSATTLEISEETMRDACRVTRWFMQHLEASQRRVNNDRLNEMREGVLKYAKMSGRKGFVMSDLTAGRVGSSSQLTPVLAELVQRNQLEIVPSTKKAGAGRPPKDRWKLSK